MADTAETITTSELTPTDAQRWDAKRKAYDVPTREDFAQFLERAGAPDVPEMRARLVYDSDGCDPREWDNLGTITYKKGGRYVLGTQAVDAEELAALVNDPQVYWAPVSAYVHSGSTIKVCGSFQWGAGADDTGEQSFADAQSGYACQWDSGVSGIVFARRADILKNFLRKRMGKDIERRAAEVLRGEVETFARFLEGDCYAILVERREVGADDDDSGEWEVVDSCCGFLGRDHAENEARSMLYHALTSELTEAENAREREAVGAAGLFGAD